MNPKLKVGTVMFLLLFAAVVYFTVHPYYSFMKDTLKISLWKTLLPGKSVRTVNNKINILLLGIAGGNHEGPNLSDSIMVIHYDFDTDTLATIGLPRDVWSTTLKQKINTAYAIGETKQKGGGLKLAKAEVGGILDLPIEYGVVITFGTFKELIDYLGGIDVTVERSFTDKEYPVEGRENDTCGGDPEFRCRYQTLSFEKGTTHMDGETALMFVRSRHAQGAEGSDFARSKRQQRVVSALKDRIIATIKKGNIREIKGLYETVNRLVERDINNQQLTVIAKNIVLSKQFKQTNISLPTDYFEVPSSGKYNGQYVLTPPDGDYEAFHELVACMLEKPLSECPGLSEEE